MREFFEKLYREDKNEFYKESVHCLKNGKKMFVATVNPESIVVGKRNEAMNKILKKDTTIIIPDGIGVVKGANYLGISIKERITGVDYVTFLLENLNKCSRKVFLYGAREVVLQQLIKKIKDKYPKIKIVGSFNGYNWDENLIEDEIIKNEPDVILVALGIPKQEIFIDRIYEKCNKGIFVGVGGAFDVISDTKKRAPKIFIKLNLEWLYRLGKEPKRLGRFCRCNLRYLYEMRRLKKNWK